MTHGFKLHAGHMEVAVAKLLGWREGTIVPNVSWGFGLRHECDLLVLDKKNRLTEIEIKISKSDLRADFKKGHGHESELIGRLVYAVSEPVLDLAKEIVPSDCGLIVVKETSWGFRAEWVRTCKHRKDAKPIGDKLAMKLMHLGCMRIWSLKDALYSATREKHLLIQKVLNKQ